MMMPNNNAITQQSRDWFRNGGMGRAFGPGGHGLYSMFPILGTNFVQRNGQGTNLLDMFRLLKQSGPGSRLMMLGPFWAGWPGMTQEQASPFMSALGQDPSQFGKLDPKQMLLEVLTKRRTG